MTTPTPAAVVPPPACTAPSSFMSISAVKLSLTRSMKSHDRRERRRVDRGERDRAVVGGAQRRTAGDTDAGAHGAPCGRAAPRRAPGCATVQWPTRPRSTISAESGGDSFDVERRLPARRGAAGVEPRLVADHPPGHARDPVGADLPCEHAELRGRERRVAVALEHEVAPPQRRRPARPRRARRSRSGTRARAPSARRTSRRASRSTPAAAAASALWENTTRAGRRGRPPSAPEAAQLTAGRVERALEPQPERAPPLAAAAAAAASAAATTPAAARTRARTTGPLFGRVLGVVKGRGSGRAEDWAARPIRLADARSIIDARGAETAAVVLERIEELLDAPATGASAPTLAHLEDDAHRRLRPGARPRGRAARGSSAASARSRRNADGPRRVRVSRRSSPRSPCGWRAADRRAARGCASLLGTLHERRARRGSPRRV